MRALITASFDPAARARLERLMDVVHEDWKERGAIHFDGAEFAAHIRDVVADVLIVEANLVNADVLNACPLRMIGCCRGDPVNVDLALATDPCTADVPPGVTLVALDDLLREAEVGSLHAPLTPETYGLLSRARLALLRPSAFFINTARAHLTDEDALYEMLRDGLLAGA